MASTSSTYTFHTTTQYISMIRAYGYHLWRLNPCLQMETPHPKERIDIIASYEMEESVSILFGLSYNQTYIIRYKDYPDLKLELLESKDFKGTGTGLSKWCDILIHITAESRAAAEIIMTGFVNDAIAFTKKKDNGKISVRIYEKQCGWRFLSDIPPRPLDTIYMDPKLKDAIVNDVNRFVTGEEEYIQLGMPYKRCYLFHGKAGSGKTSLISAIASMLKKDMSVFTFSAELTDNSFVVAVSQLSTDILVLEDVDALFVDRSPTCSNRTSFSMLLNVLDGVCRKEGMMVFITTNHIKRLDPALLRPGRIDYTLSFSNATKLQTEQIYEKFRGGLGSPTEFTKFYDTIKGRDIGISLIQKFLFDHRTEPNIMVHKKELLNLITDHEEKDVIGIS